MINKLKKQSFIFKLFITSFPDYESFILSKLIYSINKTLNQLISHISFLNLKHIPLKSITLPLFFISLIFGMGYDIQFLTTLSSTGTQAISEQVLINILFILLLLPLTVSLFLYNQKSKKIVIYGFEIILLFFLIISEISILQTINNQASILWFIKLIRGLTIYLIFSRIVLNRHEKISIVLAFIITFFFEFILSVFQFVKGGFIGIPIIEGVDRIIRPTQVLMNVGDSQYFRAVGTFPHPNLLGTYIAFLLPIITIFSFSKNKYFQYISYFSIALGLIILLLTLSRWSLIMGLFSIFVTFLLLSMFNYLDIKKALLLIKPYLFILFFLILILIIHPATRERFLNFLPEDKSLESRMDLFSESVYIIKNNPFGIGGGTFQNYFINYDITDTNLSDRFIASVHNFYFLLASEIGILGLFIFLAFILEVVKFVVIKINKLGNQEKLIALGFFASFITFLIHGFWEPQGLGDRTGLFFWINLGLLINIVTKKGGNEKI